MKYLHQIFLVRNAEWNLRDKNGLKEDVEDAGLQMQAVRGSISWRGEANELSFLRGSNRVHDIC